MKKQKLKKMCGKVLGVALAACLAGCATSPSSKSSTDTRVDAFFKIAPLSTRNKAFFSKSTAERAALFDRMTFVSDVEAFQPTNKNLPLNELYLAQAETNKNKTVLAPLRNGFYSSIGQIRAAQAKGYTVCLGPAITANDVVIGLQSNPDMILLPKTISIQKLRDVLVNHHPIAFEIIDLNDPKTAKDVCNYDRAATRAKGTTLRVLSYNILADYWNEKRQIEPRAANVAATIHHLKPDVIGLQEAQKEWYLALENQIAPYRFATQKNPTDQKVNPSCNLLYHAERFRQLDGGIEPYLDRWIRCLHWALLEEKSTGKKLILTNTHWSLTELQRVNSALKMSEFVKTLAKKYNAPVVCTGDFNSTVKDPSFQLFLERTAYRDAMASAQIKENNNFSSFAYPPIATAPYPGEQHIDHVVISHEWTPLAARLILAPHLAEASDHFPLVVDLGPAKSEAPSSRALRK